MARKPGLGKGLDAIFQNGESEQHDTSRDVSIPISKIAYNPRQPRQNFDKNDLEELAASIREHGILQPLIVTYDAEKDKYQLIAGERRLRAANLASLHSVPVIVREASQQQSLELALIENVQRADLSPLETARAYQQLNDEFGLSHDDIAVKVGKSRVSVTNTLRLLKLPQPIQDKLSAGVISEGHARAILSLNNKPAQMAAMQTIIKNGLNVRQAEELIKKLAGEKPKKQPKPAPSPEISHLEEKLRNHFGTKVNLSTSKNGGSLVIKFYSEEELNSLLNKIFGE